MRPRGSGVVLEGRRKRAIALLQAGLSLHEVARRIGCHASSVMRWRNVWQAQGLEGLKTKASGGRPARLSEPERRRLVALLRAGALSYGFKDDIWTAERVAALIRRKFAVRYHPDHVCRLLRKLNWVFVPRTGGSNGNGSSGERHWGWIPPEKAATQLQETATGTSNLP